ncbi:unnamed protein product [Rotaria sp. Silwood2]|nr:unnamed protein product [Rotaria sp. Silwood2]CAF2884664.1 unnamed protein product [Rotaria sp. Silwood2]CAF3150554.1 unnamed protein product [Rotaria sp. Silwood2]CAF4022027.1 unnamed protein product [Rotaria sp. Silwood2]CAF4100106.1 unnamed protein product [Rotaria sp. Silwood2]
MTDPPASTKKTARTFDLQAMMNQARLGAQERTKIDWSNEIEKAKEENELRINEMKIKADEAAKKLQISTNNDNINDDDDDDFGPSIDLATAPTADNEDTSSDDEDNNSSKPIEEDDDRLDDDEQPFFPLTHEIDLKHGTKSVSCLTTDSNGERLISGGFDYELKMWDFPTMDKTLQYSRAISPCESHQLRSIEFSPGSDMLLIASGSCQAKVISRDGKNMYECVRGDMYLIDMQKTKGHVSTLNRACWNPKDLNEFMTCSDDGTVRLWSLIRRTEHVSCIKTKSEQGKKTSTTTCTYNTYHTHVAQNEYLITAGCDDGSIQIWDRRRPFVNVTFISRRAHEPENAITSLCWSYDGRNLASRSTDHTLKLWDIRNFKQPLSEYNDLHNRFSMTNITFSPDDRFLITGTSTRKKTNDNMNDPTNVGAIYFFNRNNLAQPEGQIQVSETASVIKTLWHSKLNQIMCTTSNGIIKIFYDTIRSKQGALLFANREERQKKANDFFINMNIINPHALPLYRQDRVRNLSVIRMKNREDPVKSKRPDLPVSGAGSGGRIGVHGGTLSSYIVKNIALQKPPAQKEDSRAILLSYQEKCEQNPYWVAPAYSKSQPKAIFQSSTQDTNQKKEEDDDDDIAPLWKKQKT